MIRLKKILRLFFLVYFFLIVSRFRSYLGGADYIQDFVASINTQDIKKQKAIIYKLSNYRLKELLDRIFNKNQDKILNYLILFDDLSFLKKYLDENKSSQLSKELRSSIVQRALAAGSLNIVTKFIKKLKFLPTQKQLILSFDSIARVTNLEAIKRFVSAIKSTKLLKSLLEQRNNIDQEKNLMAFIHYIAQYCNMNWLKVYLDLDGDVKLSDANFDTAFHVAVKTLFPKALNNKVRFIKYMIKRKKIDSLFRNRQNKTAYDLAKEYLKKYKNLKKESKSMLFKVDITNKIDVYKDLVDFLRKLKD